MTDVMGTHKTRTFATSAANEPSGETLSMKHMLASLANNGDAGTTEPTADTPELGGNIVPGEENTPLSDTVSEDRFSNNGGSLISGNSVFSKIAVGDIATSFAKQWLPSMDTPKYIGESDMLLAYLQRLERLHGITMPIKACGVDPIVFENIKYSGEMGSGFEKLFSITSTDSTDENSQNESYYELITVDGDLYLSCASDCLDEDYLNRILSDATAAVKETGEYIFKMVGYRKLIPENGASTARLLSTLRLNSFEMSVLITYMEQFEGISVSYETINNHQCIVFRV